jgi:predicted ABC-type ATPase
MVAGPNGSGKSTLIDALRSSQDVRLPAIYINADEIQKSQGLDSRTAQAAAAELRARAIDAGDDLVYETVMSHPGKVAELQRAQMAGFHVTVHFVATEDPDINVARVALRVAAAGHPVPEHAIRQRYRRTMGLIPAALRHANDAFIFDNSRRGIDGGLQLQARLLGRRLQLVVAQPSKWVRALVDRMQERANGFEFLRSDHEARGVPLQAARLDGGDTEGPIMTVAGLDFAVQEEQRSNTLVLHDRALLLEGPGIELGKAFRITYREGVGTTELL